MNPDWIKVVGLAASVALPLWNIPLMLRIGRRKSSKDIGMLWTLGVFGCLLLMLPAALRSSDVVFKAFGIANVALFSGVVWQVLRYR